MTENYTSAYTFENFTNSQNSTPSSSNWTIEQAFYTYSVTVSVVLCFVYAVVFVVGIVGNCFVVAVIYRSPRMRTVTSFFIANLALADILVIVFCVPITLVANLVTPWILGELACKAVSYLQGVSVSASIYTLVAISADKFMAIYFMRREITSKNCRRIIVIIWLFSLMLASPWAIFFSLKADESNPNLVHCKEMWPSPEAENTYFFIANFFLCYLFPLFLITLCYLLIFVKVWRRKLPGDSSSKSAAIIARKSRIKVIKMMATVCFMFALSWLPLYAIVSRVRTIDYNTISDTEANFFTNMIPVSQWLGVSNSCVNPIIYAFYNHKFRAGFKAILLDRDCCGTLRADFSANSHRSTVAPSVNYTVKIPNSKD